MQRGAHGAYPCSFQYSYALSENDGAEKEERIMGEREESVTERMVRERPWRVHEAEHREPCTGLADLFQSFSESRTTSYAARGLVQGIVLAAERDHRLGHGFDKTRSDDGAGRDIRELIVAFLTDIGNEDQHDRVERDLEVRRTARTTLAKHVCPLIASWSQVNHGYSPENLATLIHLIEFYGTTWDWDAGSLKGKYGHVETLTGKFLENVRQCFGCVYRELRRHLGRECGCASHGGHLAGEHLRRLNRLLVDLRWWDVLSRARAVSAIPEIYVAAHNYSSTPIDTKLQFDWAGVEEHRTGGLFTHRAFIEEHREAILHDLWAIQIVAGMEGLVPATIESADGFRPLLLDLVATFVREMEIAHPGALSGDMPLPEDQTCLHHDECVDEAVRKGRAERAAQ